MEDLLKECLKECAQDWYTRRNRQWNEEEGIDEYTIYKSAPDLTRELAHKLIEKGVQLPTKP